MVNRLPQDQPKNELNMTLIFYSHKISIRSKPNECLHEL